MRIMLLIAWITAAIISSPQFIVWRLYQAFDNPPWSQCMQIWEIERAQFFLKETNKSSIKMFNSKLYEEESFYVILHMLLIFWIPAIIIMLCYLLLSCWVYINSKPNFFDLINSSSSAADKDGSNNQQIQMLNLLNQQKHLNTQNVSNGNSGGGGVLIALRSSRVSYQLAPVNNSSTITQGHETQNTTIFTNTLNNECISINKKTNDCIK
ncbi:G_PROTEIN_RECEP_F1_2 domain-containing protein [Meloidogyne graminicola]|uniref:G_PROTEIN_RECEP_F1_2 domain-containing protein n=1 Tax=Meloidogyne graminicola TaxID=189291 RepID=A0A8S9ZV80_9BILA|nr:G_PROTEIN_RECEP_F1_2 domain-containing protein [Meloidogyne graminicola]